jgi:nucleotide-binding universal stress UspA family protein
MSYKSILVQIDSGQQGWQRIKVAANLAYRFDAHLTGLATIGTLQIAAPLGHDPITTYNIQAIEQLRESAELAVKEFSEFCKAEGVRSFEAYAEEGSPVEKVSQHARYCDLLVLGQSGDSNQFIPTPEDLPEGVLFASCRPIVYVPYAGKFEAIGGKILILWNGSLEAARAVRDAIPLLQRANKVQIACFNAKTKPNQGAEPGTDVSHYLSHHGIKASVTRSTVSGEIGEHALSLATDTDADLIVMGGYGHSRIREWFLGGVTRTILKSMTVPVLMAH